MKNFISLTDKDTFTKNDFEKPDNYELRPTVKVIVENNEGKIAMVTSDIHGLFLLPGGGADSEDLKKEAERECEEEINYNVEIKDIIATSEELRNKSARKYTTTCFYAESVSESNNDTRTESEKENNLRVEWFSKEESLEIVSQQIEMLNKGEVVHYNIKFNILRDGFFIRCYFDQN